MAIAGTVAAVDSVMGGGLGVVPPALLVSGGAAVAFRASRAPRSLWSGGLKADFFLLGLALALGGLIELLHVFDLLPGDAPHLALAGALALAAAWLLTGESRRFKVEARVIGALRVSGFFLVVSAAIRVLAVGLGEAHGQATILSMVLLAVAGLALIRACTRTQAVGWQRL